MCKAIKELEDIILKCVEFQENFKEYSEKQSSFDKKLADIHHFIEEEKEEELTSEKGLFYTLEQLKLYGRRRKVKNELRMYQRGLFRVKNIEKNLNKLVVKLKVEKKELEELAKNNNAYRPRVLDKEVFFEKGAASNE